MVPTHPPPLPPPPTQSPPTYHLTSSSTPPQPPPKLRLLISHGGQILPRPQTKTLFYSGGETRLISVARTTALSISSLFSHLSKSLNIPHNSNPFILKYQLPNIDLDSLISISSDEDLQNMIEEYDRVSTTGSGRIRFFVFRNYGGVDGGDDWGCDVLKVEGSKPENCDNGGDRESIVLESCSSFGSTNSSNSHGVFKGADDLKIVLPSFDSLGSDTSSPSPSFSQQAIIYQDASVSPDAKPISLNLFDIETTTSDRTPRNDILTPFQGSSYMVSKPPINQPQHQSPPPPPPPPPSQGYYIHHPGPTPHSNYVTQYYPTSIPIAYAPMYHNTYVQPQQHFQYQINKPYPVYMIPVTQTQNIYVPSSMHNLTSQPQESSNPVVVSRMGCEGDKPMNQPSQAQANLLVLQPFKTRITSTSMKI